MWIAIAAASLPLAPATPAGAAAMLRPLTQLGGPQVLLSDLFDEAGPQAARALGAAPDPGGSITVEAPQLAAIARQFGVAWRPASPTDRAVLQRPGVPLPREDVLAAIRLALDGSGAGGGEVELSGFTAPLIAPEARARIAIEQWDFESGSGRFTGSLTVSGNAIAPLRLRVSGRLDATQEVLVAARRLAAGQPIAGGDLRRGRVRTARLPGEVVREPGQAEGLAPRRAFAAGEAVPLDDLVPALVVRRGARVAVALDAPGLVLASTAEALDAGAVGARIRVLNPSSRAILLADVTGPGTVRIEPGRLPLRPAGGPGVPP